MYYVRLFIVEKLGFGTALGRCEIHSKPYPLMQKTYISYTSENLAACAGMCLRIHALAHIRRPQPMYAGRWSLWSFYFQKYIFAYLKGCIVHFNIPQVNLISD